MKRLAIIGSSDLGQLIAHHAQTAGFAIAGYFDDYKPIGTLVDGFPVLGGIADVQAAYPTQFDELIVAIGYKYFSARKSVFEQFSGKIPFATLIHPSTYVDASCTIGPGSCLFPGCVLDRNVVIGNNVLLNTACAIAHDTAIGDHTFLSPRVAAAGFIKIGECCNIGINTTIIDNISIAGRAQTGGGAVVIQDITTAGLYVGIPARMVRAFEAQ